MFILMHPWCPDLQSANPEPRGAPRAPRRTQSPGAHPEPWGAPRPGAHPDPQSASPDPQPVREPRPILFFVGFFIKIIFI